MNAELVAELERLRALMEDIEDGSRVWTYGPYVTEWEETEATPLAREALIQIDAAIVRAKGAQDE